MKLVMGSLNKVWLRGLLSESIGRCTKVRAAVAYAQNGHDFFDHCKREGVFLKYYGLLDFESAVSPTLLQEFQVWGSTRVDCRLVYGHFHPKVIWWEDFGVYIGSANLTKKAWSDNVECGVFYTQEEVEAQGLEAELEEMFEYIQGQSVPVTDELIEKLKRIEKESGRYSAEARAQRERYERLFSNLRPHPGIGSFHMPEKHRTTARDKFMKEWAETLQTLRNLARDFKQLDRRPTWVSPTANDAVHFDQLLHAYYYGVVCKAEAENEDEKGSVARVNEAYARNKDRREAALLEAVNYWVGLKEAPFSEESFIAESAPRMEELFSPEGLAHMTRETFTEAMSNVHAFRTHARQQANTFFNLPAGYKATEAERVRLLAHWLWEHKHPSGKHVRDLLRYLLWNPLPEMEERLWTCLRDPAWKIEHLGQSALGEVIGWARPDKYPPRNDRTNKALRALGYDIKLFGE